MNKDNAKEFLPLVQALAEGKTIQFLRNGEKWEDHPSPGFCGSSPRFFRVKPEPIALEGRCIETEWSPDYGLLAHFEIITKDAEKLCLVGNKATITIHL